MSYYRYIAGVYKSYWPELNRSLRSSSVPRHVPQPVPSRVERASSVPAEDYYRHAAYFTGRVSAQPFNQRALSLPRQISYSYDTRTIVGQPVTDADESRYYSDFDCKVLDYVGRLGREDAVRSAVSRSRARTRESDSFASRYNFYDGAKHCADYLYPVTREVLGAWKHSGLSAETLRLRNQRARSPLVSRELDRYYEKRSNYVGDFSQASCSFRHYNYRRVPYFGGSDEYSYLKRKPFQGARGV